MKHEAEIKELLISNTISLVAEGGFEKATTKELTFYEKNLPIYKMNEVYIDRLFGSKRRLYESAFERLERELYYALRKAVEESGGFEKITKERLYTFFSVIWTFILENEAHCRCYVRYYYSIYFKGHSKEAHDQLFAGIIREMTPIFKSEADVVSIVHSIFTAMLDFAIRVYNGDLADDDVNRPHIFNVLYCMAATYLKEDEQAPLTEPLI